MDELLEPPAAKRPPGHPPEGAAIVPAHADAPEDARENAKPTADTVRREAAGVHGVAEATAERVRVLVRIARIKSLGIERRLNATPPHVEDGVVGEQEVNIGFPPFLVAQPTRALQARPERRLR